LVNLSIMKKLIALLFVLINAFYIGLIIMRAIYSHNQLIIDYSKYNPVTLPHNFFWDTLPTVLCLSIYAGMAVVLTMFREKFWISIGPAIFAIQMLTATVVKNRIYNVVGHNHTDIYPAVSRVNGILTLGSFFTMLYMLVAMFLTRDVYIRPYFRAFVFAIGFSILMSFFSNLMYAFPSSRGLHLNLQLITDICYVASLALFIRVFLLFLKDEPLVESVA
jgi:hypothetical protein